MVWGDRDRIVQVLVNLLSNAAKFAPEGSGQVQIDLSPVTDGWRVCVSDNGYGIPESDLERVFEKFHQTARGGAKPGGTGLGLPISRQIIDNLGGRIWAESAPGKGATLCFELPAHAANPSDPRHDHE
jgi:signal transduction histidine kinase